MTCSSDESCDYTRPKLEKFIKISYKKTFQVLMMFFIFQRHLPTTQAEPSFDTSFFEDSLWHLKHASITWTRQIAQISHSTSLKAKIEDQVFVEITQYLPRPHRDRVPFLQAEHLFRFRWIRIFELIVIISHYSN